jgi:hypothetical protein
VLRSGHKNFSMSCNNNNNNNDVDEGVPVVQAPNPLTGSFIVTNKQRKCGQCGQTGHNKRSCNANRAQGKFRPVDCCLQSKMTQLFIFFYRKPPLYQCSCLRYIPTDTISPYSHNRKGTITLLQQYQFQ